MFRGALMLLFAVAGCGGDRLYTGPMVVPDSVRVGAGEYTAFTVQIFHGQRAPMPVNSATARCTPVATCHADVVEQGIVVVGRHPGRATLKLDLTHPITGKNRKKTVAVEIREPKRLRRLELGGPVPSTVGTPAEIEMTTGFYQCESLGPDGSTVLLDCIAPYQVDGESFRYRRTQKGLNRVLPSMRACVAPATGSIMTISVAALELLRGSPTSACAPTPRDTKLAPDDGGKPDSAGVATE